MASERTRRTGETETDDTNTRLSESMGLREAFAQTNPALAARLARKDAPKLTAEQQELLAIVFDDDDRFGARDRARMLHARIGANVNERLEAFLKIHKRAEKFRVVEVALDRFLRDLGL